jgi:hypothetical protein
MNDDTPTAPEAPAAGDGAPLIDSRASFVQALHWGFEAALAGQARQIVCIDPDFAHWPLDDAALHSALARWLRLPLRRLVLVAASYDEVPRRHPRFMAWRRDWAHAISPLAAPEELAASLSTLLLDDGAISVQLFDDKHWRGRAQRDARSAHLLRLEADALMQRCSPALAINVLGL